MFERLVGAQIGGWWWTLGIVVVIGVLSVVTRLRRRR
jgi:hypothetical protein